MSGRKIRKRIKVSFTWNGIESSSSVVELSLSTLRDFADLSIYEMVLQCHCLGGLLKNSVFRDKHSGKEIHKDILALDLLNHEILIDLCPSERKHKREGTWWKGNFRDLRNYFKIPVLIPIMLSIIWISSWSDDTDKVCFGELGCFPLGHPWSTRPAIFHFVPQSPSVIRTTFKLFSENPSINEEFVSWDFHPKKYKINWDKSLHFIVHGYMDDAKTWSLVLKDTIHQRDANVIVVEWSEGAKLYYPQVVANTRIVAEEICRVLKTLTSQTQFSLTNIHLIGHSLGAHIAGYVGKSIKGIRKITALDPAFPLYEHYPSQLGLHASDAQTVQVFHTNVGTLGFGIQSPVGTRDIYVNNGRNQPGCKDIANLLIPLRIDHIKDFQSELACSHRRAYHVYKEILKQNGTYFFYPLPRPSALWESFEKLNFTNGQVLRYNDEDDELVGNFFMPTNDKYPYLF